MTSCVAPRCAATASSGSFCAAHAAAPAGRRGGWLSAHRRRAALANAAGGTETIDATNVYRRMWVGGRPAPHLALPAFSLVVLCAVEYQPDPVAFRGRVLRVRLDDAGPAPTTREIAEAAGASARVAAEVRRGGRALVTCHQGRNRSAFVAALAMVQLCQLPIAEIIARLRAARGPHALSNPHFVAFLERCHRR